MKTLFILLMLSIGLTAQAQKKDTVKVMVLYTIVDTTNTIASSFSDTKVYWGYVYSVRELHNIAEGLIDPYFAKCLDETGKEIPCYTDYWKHIKYLNFPFKIEIPNNMMIWQSKDVYTKSQFFNKPQP